VHIYAEEKEGKGGGEGREREREREREPHLATAFESFRRYFDCERSEVLGQVST